MNRNTYEDRLMAHGFKMIGSGLFAAVFAKPGSDRVIKVCCDNDWEAYIVWAIRHGFAGNFAPMVYALHRHDIDGYPFIAASMERLTMTVSASRDDECRTYCSDLKYSGEGRAILERRFPGITCFAKQARAAGFASDWHGSNWMLHNDGKRLVLIDPQSGARSSALKRWRPAGTDIRAA